MVSATSMVLITGAAVVTTALLTAALLAILGSRFLRERMDAAGEQVAAKVRSAVVEAVEEALPRRSSRDSARRSKVAFVMRRRMRYLSCGSRCGTGSRKHWRRR